MYLFMQLLESYIFVLILEHDFLTKRNSTKDCLNMPFIVSASDLAHVVNCSYGMGKPAVLFLCFANKW